jgi:hypothetical protein
MLIKVAADAKPCASARNDPASLGRDAAGPSPVAAILSLIVITHPYDRNLLSGRDYRPWRCQCKLAAEIPAEFRPQ